MKHMEKNDKVLTDGIAALTGKYLTFELQQELYGLDVMQIMQIIGIPEITPIPRTPDYVKGVINLRGKIIPVIDLRVRFSLEEQKYTEESAIIIVEVPEDDGKINLGIIVDRVADVLDISEDHLEATPSFGVEVEADFILGMAKVKDRIITLLDMGNILTSSELVELQNIKKD